MSSSLPPRIDLTRTDVKNSGPCRSSWAFAMADSIDTQIYNKFNQKDKTSVQQIIDCAANASGCNGGNPEEAFMYILNEGIEFESSYPLDNQISFSTVCRYDHSKVEYKVNEWVKIDYGDENGLMKALASNNTVVASIIVTNKFQFYSSGIFEDCANFTISNHYVLVVGYETECFDTYLIKNSWGTDWGINGYMKLYRNGQNNCGIASRATYPIIKIMPVQIGDSTIASKEGDKNGYSKFPNYIISGVVVVLFVAIAVTVSILIFTSIRKKSQFKKSASNQGPKESFKMVNKDLS